MGFIDPDPDDYCECALGNIRWRTKWGQLVIRKLTENPFKGKVDFIAESQDEADWRAWRQQYAEKNGWEDYDPIKVVEY